MGNIISRNVKVSNTPEQPLYVDVIDPSATGSITNNYAEVLSVAGLATVTIITYTVPIGKVLRIQRVDYSGTKRSVFTLDVNATVESRRRIYCADYNGEFNMCGFKLVAGDIVKLIVENKTNTSGDFNGNIIGSLDNA